ncbi:acyltransferase domain-containing protein [Streptomyces sp. INA 01156]
MRPDAVVGHSVGELAAACVGGMLSLSEVVLFAAERGRLMGGSTAPGAMAAVRGADEQAVEDLVAASPATSRWRRTTVPADWWSPAPPRRCGRRRSCSPRGARRSVRCGCRAPSTRR